MSEQEYNEKLVSSTTLMRWMALRLTKNEDAANDLMQDAYVNLIKFKHQYDPAQGAFSTWVCKIIQNKFIDNLRSTRKERILIDDLSMAEYIPVMETPETILVDTDELNRVKNILLKLKPLQRQMIEMRMNGFKYEEIADELHLPLGTVKGEIFRARQQIGFIHHN